MEIHERFMKLPTTEVNIAEILAGSNREPGCSIIGELKKSYDSKISNKDASLKTLVTYRAILCYEYQSLMDTRHPDDRSTLRTTPPTDLRKYFAKSDERMKKDEYSALRDIVVLLSTFSQPRALVASFKDVWDELGDMSSSQNRDLAMKVAECFTDSYNLHSYLFKPESRPSELEEQLDRILGIIQAWLKQDQEDPDWKSLASLLPKLCTTFEPPKVVSPLWSQVVGETDIDPPFWSKRFEDIADLDKKLTALCVMAEVCFPLETEKIHEFHYDQCARSNFWWILNGSLTSKIPQQRKQALYLAKRAIEFVGNHEVELKRRLKQSQESAVPFVCPNSNGEDSSLEDAKRNFFLILEVLEEKQKHLVLPALSHLPSLAKLTTTNHESCCDCFNAMWLRCVLKRIVQHDNESVKIFGLQEILRSDPRVFLDDEFLLYLVDALNNNFLYDIEAESFTLKDLKTKKPLIVRELEECFIGWELKKTTLINSFVRVLPAVSWGPVAIYWILRALLAVPERGKIVTNQWGEPELRCVDDLIRKCLTTHNLRLRTASHFAIIRMLRSYVTTTAEPWILDCIFNIIVSFPDDDDKYEFRTESEWRLIAEHLSRIIASSDAVGYITHRCDKLLESEQDLESLTLVIVVLLDSGLIDEMWSVFAAKLVYLFRHLVGADKRPYANHDAVLRIIQFWGHLMMAITNPKSAATTKLDKLLSSYDDEIIKIVMRSLDRTNISSYDGYLFAIDAMICYYRWSLYGSNVRCWMDENKKLDWVEDKCINIIANPHNYCRTQWLYALKMLNVYRAQIPSYNRKPLEKEFITSLLKYFRTEVMGNGREDAAQQNDRVTGKYTFDCSKNIAELMYHCSCYSNMASFPSDINVEHELLALVETGNEFVIEHVAATLKQLLDQHYICQENLDIANSIIRVSWRNVFQLKKTNQVFENALRELTKLIVRPAYLELNGNKEYAVECVDQMMREGEASPLIKRIFIQEATFIVNDVHLFHEALMSCLLHGTVPRRDQRIECMTILHSQELCTDFWHLREDAIVRACAVKYFLNCDDEKKNQTGGDILNSLLKILEQNKNKRYYDNSHLHRLKNRVMQVLLIIEPCLNQAERQRLYDTLCDVLISESNQPSVRLMHEWLLIRLYAKDEYLREKIWTLFETAAEKRPGAVVSLASVVFHTARLLPGSTQTEYIAKAISRLLPNSMGQQFNVRLYSQSILVKIYEMLPEDSPEAKTYEEIFKGVQESLRRGNLTKNSSRVLDDFYLKIFHPDLDYNYETIFCELPRLTNLPIDEWILPKELDEHCLRRRDELDGPYFGESRHILRMAKPSLQSLKPTGDVTEFVDSSVNGGGGGISDIQKKIIPWKTMVPLYDELSEISKTKLLHRKAAQSAETGMIVVASLIDRPPNLGGLARTCEIFGAKELVIGSLRYAEDREFQTLSVSAEKWITITEVKPHLLQNYFLEKQSEGWTLIGAEQTANSKNLLEVEFPKKTILLLGNEKDGIPANLIPLLDTCVEIPQNGVVRSLNVHVTGAICIWQYAKQHVLT